MTVYDLITKHEGRKSRPYHCPAGALTIGVGHNCDSNPLPPDIAAHLEKCGSITDDMIDRLLEKDVRAAVADCHVLFPGFDEFTEARKMALVDFLFQLGFHRARTFAHAIAAINTGRWEDAAKEMRNSAWAKQTPERAGRITDMIETGEI
jgi:lysozyme